jgi:hypothetical protein
VASDKHRFAAQTGAQQAIRRRPMIFVCRFSKSGYQRDAETEKENKNSDPQNTGSQRISKPVQIAPRGRILCLNGCIGTDNGRRSTRAYCRGVSGFGSVCHAFEDSTPSVLGSSKRWLHHYLSLSAPSLGQRTWRNGAGTDLPLNYLWLQAILLDQTYSWGPLYILKSNNCLLGLAPFTPFRRVSFSPRNQMDMAVKYFLPGYLAHIYTNVETLNFGITIRQLLSPLFQ